MCDIPNNTTIPQLEEQFIFKVIVDSEANFNFNHNSADYGGALVVENSTAHININGIEYYDDRAMTSGNSTYALLHLEEQWKLFILALTYQ